MILSAQNIRQNLTERCQVCVVGSGAGGAAAAAELAMAGYEVIILEEGGYHPTSAFSHDPLRMLPRLYRNAGGDSTIGSTPILFTEGRCVGGGTTINAGICYRAPDPILHRWSMAVGALEFLPEHMHAYFDRVEAMLNVREVPDEIVSEDGKRMRTAAETLGYSYTRVKRNIHACQGTNLCIMGCPTGAKQSTLVSYIPRARAHGARLITNCRVQKINFQMGRATDVEGAIIDPITGKILHRVNIKVDAVFIAAGALQTPALLYRSGLARHRKQIGRNLYLHPNTKCVGVFDDEVHGWQGSIQGFQVDEFAEQGFTFGSTFLPPGILALSLPFYGQELGNLMRDFNRLSVWGVLVEDSHPGRVRFTRKGQPIPTYGVTAADRDRFVDGIALLTKLFFAAGARKVILPIRGFEQIESEEDIRLLANLRVRPQQLSLFTVHLMGTCRMGIDPRVSVVDPDHGVHGLQNVYVCDASVFPGPIRVNPMVTIMALATRAAIMYQEVQARQRKAA